MSFFDIYVYGFAKQLINKFEISVYWIIPFYIIVMVAAYMLGSFNFAIIISKKSITTIYENTAAATPE